MTLLLVLERPSEERFLCSASKFFFSLIMRAAANAMILILVTLFWGWQGFAPNYVGFTASLSDMCQV